ncbi:hypothetical protein ACFL27_24395 [candidate division CSSED10-310 bacterium]|uniref:Uncharacterized protein n=1 Tax=candidate division CSSED10-310 bacterium TaxID=2855610 RepID=A0ABV6Z4S2_UNCC1
MEAWQKTHTAVILPLARALYRYDSNNYKLAKSFATIRNMILATRECFKVLKSMNVPITPSKLHFYYLPSFLLTLGFMVFFRTRVAEYSMARHTAVAKEEMTVLEDIFEKYVKESQVTTKSYKKLLK